MAITFFNSATGTNLAGSDLTITLPGSMEENDLVIVASCGFRGDASSAVISTAGYTTVFNSNMDSNARISVKYKLMGASPDASVTIGDTTDSTMGLAGVALVFRGVDPVTPLDVASVTNNAGLSLDPEAITPSSNDCCIVAVVCESKDGTVTNPGTITNYTTVFVNANDTGNDALVATAYRILTGGASSSENPGAWSNSISTEVGQVTMALRPFVAAGQPYDLHEGGVKFINPHQGGQNFQVWRKAGEMFLPPKRRWLTA